MFSASLSNRSAFQAGLDVEVKIASEPAEWEQAFRLVRQAYEARGLQAAGSGDLRFSAHHALPGTTTFVARQDGRVIATLSLVLDNPLLGLPMESIYPDEVATLRATGARLAEVISLAGERCGPESFPVTFGLMRLLAHFFLSRRGDRILVTVHPRHRPFYQRVIGFVGIGERRACPRVENNPAEPMLLDCDQLRGNVSPRYRLLLGEDPPAEALRAPLLPPALARAFAARSSPQDAAAVDQVLAAVANHTPLAGGCRL
jgi:hypothetical protein